MENENVETQELKLMCPEDSDLAVKTKFAADLKREIEAVEHSLKIREEALKKVSNEIRNVLEAMELDSLKAHGFTFYIEEKESVKTPKTLEEKRLFFEYLQSIGMYDEMVSINSQTLNSLFKTMSEKAAEEGILDFVMPGIEAPTSYKNLKMRKI